MGAYKTDKESNSIRMSMIRIQYVYIFINIYENTAIINTKK